MHVHAFIFRHSNYDSQIVTLCIRLADILKDVLGSHEVWNRESNILQLQYVVL